MKYSIDTQKYVPKMLSFCRSQGVNINLENPVTIQDKMAWLNIYDTDPLKVKCADKIRLHEYCKEILGEDICIPLIKTYNSTSEINWDELPDKFVIKCNHGSGMNVIVSDKKSVDKNGIIQKLNRWMKTDFSMQNGFESHYHDIPHKILVEQYMNDGTLSGLTDYKFWCFNGEPGFIHVVNDRFSNNMHFNFYDVYFNKIDLAQTNHPVSPNLIDKPKHLSEMVECGKKLSSNFKFVRVDFYEINDRIYLGELTFTPDALVFKYRNNEDNVRIGNLLKI